MPDEVKPEPATQAHPRCPHCNHEPMTLGVQDLTFPNGTVLVMAWCGNPKCRRVMGASYKGQVPARIVPGVVRPIS